jgi:membrane-anchored protein YejM (alkaline phosphatase superfamily)
MVQRGRTHTHRDVIRRLRIAYWITEATDTRRIYNTAFPLQQWLGERASVLTFIRTLLVLLIACLVMQTSRLEQLMAFIDKWAVRFLKLLFSSTAFRCSFMFISRRWNEACNLDHFRPQNLFFVST